MSQENEGKKTFRKYMIDLCDEMKVELGREHDSRDKIIEGLATLWSLYSQFFQPLSDVTTMVVGSSDQENLEVLVEGIKRHPAFHRIILAREMPTPKNIS